MPEEVWDDCLHSVIPIELLDLQSHPTPSDLAKRLGKEFVDVFFQTCTPIERVLFGRDKTLQGPPDAHRLWINPADRLRASECGGGPVCITEQPSHAECLQALSHRGILEIGERVEERIATERKSAVAAAVRDAEELERFEADKRIEFHVAEAVERVNEDWRRRFDELSAGYKEERESLIRVFQDARKMLCEFLEQKQREEIDACVERAVDETRREMEAKCARTVDDELAQQQTLFERSMETTLNNLKASDRDKMNELRNQCLRAMDVQSHLMTCRQITELVHMMSVERSHWQRKLSAMREKHETEIISLQMRLNSLVGELQREHQSDSIIVVLWSRFFASLNVVDVSRLTENEQRLFFEFQQIQCDLMGGFEDNTSRIFTLDDESSEEGEEADQKSLDTDDDDAIRSQKNIDECIRRGNAIKDSTIAINWQRQSPMEIDSLEDPFMSSLFHRTAPDTRDSVNMASSIIALVRASSTDDEQLADVIAGMLQDVAGARKEKLPSYSLISMPRTNRLQIKDSKEIIERRISMATNESESHHTGLLGTVDSLEMLSRRTTKDEAEIDECVVHRISSDLSLDLDRDEKFIVTPRNSAATAQSSLDKFPAYMRIPNYTYKKMTAKEWDKLKLMEDLQSKLHSQRASSIVFSETPTASLDTSKPTERCSIMKANAESSHRHDLDRQHDALFPIHEKCRETLKNMKVKSVLKMLCDDDDDDITICGGGASEGGKMNRKRKS